MTIRDTFAPANTEEPAKPQRGETIQGTVYHLGDGYGFCESPAIPYTRIFFHWQSLLHTTLHFSKIKNGATLEFVASEEKNNKTGVMEWRAYKVKVIKNGN